MPSGSGYAVAVGCHVDVVDVATGAVTRVRNDHRSGSDDGPGRDRFDDHGGDR